MGKLNATAEAQIREICDRYKGEKTPLMMILSDIQNEYGYIPLEVQEVVSEKTGISVAEIYRSQYRFKHFDCFSVLHLSLHHGGCFHDGHTANFVILLNCFEVASKLLRSCKMLQNR